MNLAQRIAVAVTLVVVALWLFVEAAAIGEYTPVLMIVGIGILFLGGAAVLLLGIKRKRA